MEQYNDALKIYKKENIYLKQKNNGLEENNKYLRERIDSLPSFIKKLFLKDVKLLK